MCARSYTEGNCWSGRESSWIFWFPKVKDLNLWQEWLVKIQRDVGPHFKLPDATEICFLHFHPSDAKKGTGGKKWWFPGELRLVSAIHQHLEQLKRLVVKTTFGWISNPNRLEESDLSVSYSESTPESSSASPIEMIKEIQESLDPSELLKHQLLQTEAEIARLSEQTRLLKENLVKKIKT